jgi:hypothetical protein
MRHTTSLFLAGLASAAAALAPAAASAGSERSASAIDSHQAQSTEFSAQQRRRIPPRIYVYPDYRNRPIVRRCVDWYTVEARAAGDTVVPHMRCYWVVGR